MEKKKILIITEYIGENDNSTAYYWAQITKKLNNNFDVVLIAPDSKGAQDFTEKHQIKFSCIEYLNYNKHKLSDRVFGQLKQTFRLVRVIRKELKTVDLVFSGTNPIVTMFAMAVIKKINKFKWLVLVHDVFPDNLIAAGVIKKSSYIYKLTSYFSNKVYSTPDRLICIGRDMKNLLKKNKKVSGKVDFVPNWASTDNIKQEEKKDNLILSELSWSNHIVFQFFGNMGRLQGVYNLLKAIEMSKNKNARFLFIGSGSESKYVEEFASRMNSYYGYQRIYYYGQLNLEKNNIGLNACDVAFVTLSPQMYGLGVPSKAYFSIAANKPILYVGDNGSELELLLSEHDIGWYCNSASEPLVLAQLIDSITEDYILGRVSKLQPRKVLESKFSEEDALHSLAEVVKDVMYS